MSVHIVYVFIDAANIWNAQKVKGFLFDYKKLETFLKDGHKADILKIFYYTAYPKKETRDYDVSGKHAFYTYLKKGLGFTVRKKALKQIKVATEGEVGVIEKGDMDVELTVDAMHNRDMFNTAIFFTGDSDYMALINHLKGRGKNILIYSSENNISSELRTGGHGYYDILKIRKDIWGNKLHFKNQRK